MGLLIFILLLCFFFWALPRVMAYLLQRKARKFFGSFFDAANGAQGAQNQQAPHEQPRHRRPRKKIDRDVGEYVEFEEISVYQNSTTNATETADQTSYTSETQIEDAVWEDIK